MRAWMFALALLVALCACGRYGPPVRSTASASAPSQAEMPEDPNCERTLERQP
jgi:predicted small lipoprotein YifL